MKLIESYERSSVLLLGSNNYYNKAQLADNQGESFVFLGNDETVPDEFLKKVNIKKIRIHFIIMVL